MFESHIREDIAGVTLSSNSLCSVLQLLDVSLNPGTGQGPPTRGKLASAQSSMPGLGVGQVPSACPCRPTTKRYRRMCSVTISCQTHTCEKTLAKGVAESVWNPVHCPGFTARRLAESKTTSTASSNKESKNLNKSFAAGLLLLMMLPHTQACPCERLKSGEIHYHSRRPTPLPSRNIRACRFRCLLHILPA